MNYQRIAAEVFNQPILMEPARLEAVISALNSQITGHGLRDVTEQERRHAGYEVVKGVGVINVMGALVHRGSWLGAMCGLTGYDFLENALNTALDDDSVERIALVCDSGGGQASGAFDFSDKIYESRGIKPMTAIVSDAAYSACYLIASAADEVVVTRTGGVGSVGVVMAHADVSQSDAKQGLKLTYIHSGDHKVDGNPHEPLTDSAKGRLQAECDALYDLFIDTVARNRGMTTETVRATQALTYTGQKGIDIGFADRINSEGKELSRLFGMSNAASSRHSPLLITETPTMSDKDKAGSELTAEQVLGKTKAAKAEGVIEGATAERSRISTILEANSSKPKAANQVAFHTDMSVEAAAAFIGGMPEENKDKGAGLDELLDGTNPDLNDSPDSPEGPNVAELWGESFKKVGA